MIDTASAATDYDAYGIVISAATISKTARIGIDLDIIKWLRQNGYPHLKVEDVEEEYVSGIATDIEYLKNHRIELDSIAEKAGPELFWKYVRHKIEVLQKEKVLITRISYFNQSQKSCILKLWTI